MGSHDSHFDVKTYSLLQHYSMGVGPEGQYGCLTEILRLPAVYRLGTNYHYNSNLAASGGTDRQNRPGEWCRTTTLFISWTSPASKKPCNTRTTCRSTSAAAQPMRKNNTNMRNNNLAVGATTATDPGISRRRRPSKYPGYFGRSVSTNFGKEVVTLDILMKTDPDKVICTINLLANHVSASQPRE